MEVFGKLVGSKVMVTQSVAHSLLCDLMDKLMNNLMRAASLSVGVIHFGKWETRVVLERRDRREKEEIEEKIRKRIY